MADKKRNYKVLEHDERQGLAPMAVGAESQAGKGHSSGCVLGAVVFTVVLCALALGGSTQTDLLSQLGVCGRADESCETTACVELAS